MDALSPGRLISPFANGSLEPRVSRFSDTAQHQPKAATESVHIELTGAAGSPLQILNAELLRALDAALAEDSLVLDHEAGAGEFTPEQVAARVLGFIDAVANQYASDDPRRMTMLDEARAGVELGFEEAEDILKSLGVLRGGIAGNIDRTYELIRKGLERMEDVAPVMADEPGVEKSVHEVQRAVQSTRFSSRQSTSLVIDTNDGDRVTIEIEKQANASRTVFTSDDGERRVSGFESSIAAKVEFSFRVEGDLDEEEREAIEDLIARVDKVSDKFFDGNIQAAFNKAAKLRFDSEELAGFSLEMNRARHVEAVAAYRQAMPSTEESAGLAEVAAFAVDLRSLFSDANQHRFATPEKAVADLLDHLTSERAGIQERRAGENALSMLRGLVDELVSRRMEEREYDQKMLEADGHEADDD